MPKPIRVRTIPRTTAESRGRFRGRGCSRPCRVRIRLIVAVEGTHDPLDGLAQQLHPDPLRPPPRMLAPQLRHQNLHRLRRLVGTRGRPMRPIRQPADLFGQIPAHSPMHRHPVHPDLRRHLGDPAPANTARTASRRCSTTDKTSSANPGLPEPWTPHENVLPQSADHGQVMHINWPNPDAHHPTEHRRSTQCRL